MVTHGVGLEGQLIELKKGVSPCQDHQQKHTPCYSNKNKLIGAEAFHVFALYLVQVERLMKHTDGQFCITLVNHA